MILECFSMLFYFLSTSSLCYTTRYHFILLLDRTYFKLVIDQTGSAIVPHWFYHGAISTVGLSANTPFYRVYQKKVIELWSALARRIFNL